MIEHVIHDGQELAMIIRQEYQTDGISFITDPQSELQLGYMNRGSGYQIPPHVHKPVQRQIRQTQEVLYIKSGQVRVDFYDDQQEYLHSRLLHRGDIVLLATGGHGFEMLEDSEIVEVKQGPYAGDDDKVRFRAVSPEQICIYDDYGAGEKS